MATVARNLTDEEIQETYDLLEKLHVEIDLSSIKGLHYVRERMTVCRAMQDQIQELRLKVTRAFSWVQQQLIYEKCKLRIPSISDQEKEQTRLRVSELEQQKVSHGLLRGMVAAQNTVLGATNRDLKTLADVILKQLKLGEEGGIDPMEAPSLIQPADFAQMGEPRMEDQVANYFATSDTMAAATEPDRNQPAQEPVAEEQATELREPETAKLPAPNAPVAPVETPVPQAPVPPQEAAADPFAGLGDLFEGNSLQLTTPLASRPSGEIVQTGPTTVVGFAAPLPAAEMLPRGIRVPDMSSVPIESLLEGINGQNAASHNPL